MDNGICAPIRRNVKDISGHRFGRLTVLRYLAKRYGQGRGKWLCLCQCGNHTEVIPASLKNGNTTSCGCAHRLSISSLNGVSRRRHYKRWQSMLARCNDPRNKNYKNYGARGISVCERWRSYDLFESDIGSPPSPKHSLHRKDNDGPYSPENCKWADYGEQANCRRVSRYLIHNNQKKTVAEWANLAGLKKATLYQRIKLGWSVEDALTIRHAYKTDQPRND